MINTLLHKNLINQRQKICCKIKQANISTKADMDDFVEKTYFNDKLKKLKDYLK